MKWIVEFCTEFDEEYDRLNNQVQDELIAHAELLEIFGPELGRPTVDTLKGSRYSNMKELRFKADNGVWRLAFAFDPHRQCILLVGGNKAGVSEKRFYKELIRKADERFASHLHKLRGH